MRKQWIYATQIVLSLVMACGLAVSCAVPSAIPPPSSEYPADISGHVIIAEKVIVKYDRNKPDTMELTPSEDQIYWIIDISVKNKAYENAVTASYKDWKIVADDKVYDCPKPVADIWPSTDMSVPVGGTGETTIRFRVPKTLNVSSAKLCYEGQEPYSYGKLSGGDKVAVYDWDSQTVIEQVVGSYEQFFVKREISGHKKVGEIGNLDITEPVYEYIYIELEIVGYWEKGNLGEERKYWSIPFSTTTAPWVINCGYKARQFTALDPLGSKETFGIAVFSKADYDKHFHAGAFDRALLLSPFSGYYKGEYRGVSDKGVHCVVVHDTGDYVIVLETADIVSWWVKVGVE